jgi:hypothetical protein
MPPRLIERLGMPTWIIGIDRDNPEHWEYAQQHRFWDMTTSRPFMVGDTLYFWQAGASLLGSVRVTRATEEIGPGTWMPWNLADDKREKYRHRVHFEPFHTSSANTPTWGELKLATGVKAGTNFGPQRVPPQGESWLLDQVRGREQVSNEALVLVQRFEDLADTLDANESDSERDLRARVEAIIVIRRGQPRFRRMLLGAYQGRCAITGTGIVGLLEAAHISPYKGDHTDRVSNGLLLRAEIHTLFDLHLLTVLPDLTVRVSPDALSEPYASYDGTTMTLPARRSHRPDPGVLSQHNSTCSWLPAPPEPDVALF